MARQDRTQVPTDEALRARLGPGYTAFRALIDAYPELEPEWKWYGQKSGWCLKLVDGKRNVCFLHPGDGHFTVGFTFGHDAVERALESDLPVSIRQLIGSARTYAEGRPFRLEIDSGEQLEAVHQLVRIKRAGRPGAPRHAGNRAERRAGHAPDRAKAPVAPPPPGRRAPSQRRGRSPG